MSPATRSMGLAIAMLLASCARTDPEDIDGSVECPGGKPASATMTIRGELAAIRPLGSDEKIRVRGTRKPGESSCFADGGMLSFIVMLEGQSAVDVATPPLAHGAWQLSVVPLPGGEHSALPKISHVLQPGAAYVVAVGGSTNGGLQVQVTP